MEIIDNLYLAFLISTVLFLWTETDFFVEYCTLFGLQGLFKVGSYIKYNEEAKESALGFGSADSEPVHVGYLEYLLLKHDSFFIRLMTCPICLAVWLNIFTIFVVKSFSSFSINLWVSLLLYFIIKIVTIASDERATK